jgi:hypothetical protein
MENVVSFSEHSNKRDREQPVEEREAEVEPQVEDNAFYREVTSITQPPKKKTKPDWIQAGLPSVNRVEEELGYLDGDQTECFGCVVVGEQEKTAIQFDRIVELINIIRKSIARADFITVCKYVAKKYRELQDDIEAHLGPGEKPLQDWSARMIYEHFTSHVLDPQLQLLFDLQKLQEMKKIAETACIERDEDDETTVRVNPQQFKVYSDIVKVYWQIGKVETNKFNFNSNESIVDIKAACQPILATADKTIVDYFGVQPEEEDAI